MFDWPGFRSVVDAVRVRRFALLACVAGAAAMASACTEDFEGGGACPALCPQVQAPFLDTVLGAVAFDTTVGPFPLLGLSPTTMLASRGDTIETYLVVRFDSIRSTFLPNDGTTTQPISTIDSSVLRLTIDTIASRTPTPFVLELFDVDSTLSDTSAAVMRSLFRPDRKIGELSVASELGATFLDIPVPNAYLASRIVAGQRVRLGVRIASGANIDLRVQAFTAGSGNPRLRFDPATDTIYRPLEILPNTRVPGGESDDFLLLANTVYALTVRGSPPVPPNTIAVGGWPGRRVWLRFEIPRIITDSSTVVRAELLLTQRPSFGADRGDSIGVQPYLGVSSNAVTDLYLAAALSANARLAGVDSVRFVPQDSGQRVFNIVNVVRNWSALDPNITRAIVLRSNGEGVSSSELYFFDLSAPADLRPRLRVTYLPRSEFALP